MLTTEVAVELARHQGKLFLDGVTSLSEEVARVLMDHEGGLSLSGVRTQSGAAFDERTADESK